MMKRLLALSVLVLSPIYLWAAEGRLADAPSIAPDAARVSHYTSAPSVRQGVRQLVPSVQEKTAGASTTGVEHANKALPAAKVLRAATPSMSTRATHLYIYDADSLLLTDRDADAYNSEF